MKREEMMGSIKIDNKETLSKIDQQFADLKKNIDKLINFSTSDERAIKHRAIMTYEAEQMMWRIFDSISSANFHIELNLKLYKT